MSQHPSFSRGGQVKQRSVLKRFERIKLLRKRGQWQEGRYLTSLPKTKPEE
ncbi:MAG: small basic protein [Puniceicoccales bacterium]|jgi:small basic protein (TIGR04137 family)|nr:small basic protein [Puniceicoccales bacterium]